MSPRRSTPIASLVSRTRARGPSPAGDPAAAAEALQAAIGLWRGPALHGLRDESFAAAEVARLDELRLAGLGARIEADLALGRHERVLSELAALVAEHPLREAPRLQQIRALQGSGRPARGARRRARRGRADLWPSPALALLDGRRAARAA